MEVGRWCGLGGLFPWFKTRCAAWGLRASFTGRVSIGCLVGASRGRRGVWVSCGVVGGICAARSLLGILPFRLRCCWRWSGVGGCSWLFVCVGAAAVGGSIRQPRCGLWLLHVFAGGSVGGDLHFILVRHVRRLFVAASALVWGSWISAAGTVPPVRGGLLPASAAAPASGRPDCEETGVDTKPRRGVVIFPCADCYRNHRRVCWCMNWCCHHGFCNGQ